MATLPDDLRSATETPISIDYANSWIPDVRLNGGDREGRTITVAVTDGGIPITDASGLTAKLLYNTGPGVKLGDRVDMTVVPDTATATFTGTLPYAAVRRPGVIALGVEISDGTHTLCSRNFNGIVERAVYDVDSPEVSDGLTRIEQAVRDAQTAASNARSDSETAQTQAQTATQAQTEATAAAQSAQTRAQQAAQSAEDAASASQSAQTSAQQAAQSAKDAAQFGVDVGTVTTKPSGQPASVTVAKNGSRYTLDFGLPSGPKGDKGDPGDAGKVATQTVAGVVKPGKGLTVRADGTLDAAASAYTLPPATTTTLGGVKPGGGLDVSSDGTLSTRLGAAGIGPGLGLDDHQLLQVNAGKGLQLDDAHGPSTVSVIAGNGLTFNEQNQIVASLPAMSLDAPSGRGIVRGFAVFISPQTYAVCVNRLQVVEDAETLSFQLSARNGGILFTGVYNGQQATASTSMTVTMTNSGTMFDVEFTYDTGTKHWIADRPHVGSLGMDCHPFTMLMAWQIQSAKA